MDAHEHAAMSRDERTRLFELVRTWALWSQGRALREVSTGMHDFKQARSMILLWPNHSSVESPQQTHERLWDAMCLCWMVIYSWNFSSSTRGVC